MQLLGDDVILLADLKNSVWLLRKVDSTRKWFLAVKFVGLIIIFSQIRILVASSVDTNSILNVFKNGEEKKCSILEIQILTFVLFLF